MSIDREFVLEWSERYCDVAAATSWTPPPGLRAAASVIDGLEELAFADDWSKREEKIFSTIAPAVRRRGCYTLPEFITVVYWKTPRPLKRYLENDATTVERVTRRALADDLTPSARRRVLADGLDGVGVAVASALLTVWSPFTFTIIDFRALHTLGVFGESVRGVRFADHKQPWWESHYELYLDGCASIAARCGLPQRDVDRALWRWSRSNPTVKVTR